MHWGLAASMSGASPGTLPPRVALPGSASSASPPLNTDALPVPLPASYPRVVPACPPPPPRGILKAPTTSSLGVVLTAPTASLLWPLALPGLSALAFPSPGQAAFTVQLLPHLRVRFLPAASGALFCEGEQREVSVKGPVPPPHRGAKGALRHGWRLLPPPIPGRPQLHECINWSSSYSAQSIT